MVAPIFKTIFRQNSEDELYEFEEASEDGVMIPEEHQSESDSDSWEDDDSTDNVDIDSDEWTEVIADIAEGPETSPDDEIFSEVLKCIGETPRSLNSIEEAWAEIPKICKTNVTENFSSENYCKLYALILNFKNFRDRPITDDFGRWSINVNFEKIPKIWPVLQGYAVSYKSLSGHCDRLFEEMRSKGFDFENSREMLKYLSLNKHIMNCYGEVATWRSLLCEWSDEEPWCKCVECCICTGKNPKNVNFDKNTPKNQTCSCYVGDDDECSVDYCDSCDEFNENDDDIFA